MKAHGRLLVVIVINVLGLSVGCGGGDKSVVDGGPCYDSGLDAGCDGDAGTDSDADGGTDSGADSDTDSDTDTDTDADADTDADTDGDTDGDTDSDTDTGTGDECIPGGADSMVMDIPVGISVPAANIETIPFASSDPVYLDVSTALGQVHHSMINNFMQNEKPIYVSIEPVARTVVNVIQPIEGPVAAVTPTADGAEVELLHSAAIHILWNTNECFDHLYQALVDALADQSDQEVSNDLNHYDGIVDVRPAFGL
jgi:hypothetical protein